MIATYTQLRLVIFLIFGLAFLIFFVPTVQAQALPVTTDLDGYAWSSTVGWVSLNCKTGGATGNDICAISNYKVTINTNRTITGYAWSSNIGWVKFDGLSSYPTGGGTASVAAVVTGAYPNLTFSGWARACAGTVPGDCSSMTSRSDGWDGWIALAGTGYFVATNVSGMAANSYAWGDVVVGWLDMFSNVVWLKPSATLTVAGCTVPVGASTCSAIANWTILNATTPILRNDTTASTVSTNPTGLNVLQTLALGSNSFSALAGTLTLATVSATASCTPGTILAGVTCELPPPVITMVASKPIVRKGDTVTLSWTITPAPPLSGVCTLRGPGLTGAVTTGGSQTSAALNSYSVFSITCVGPFGTVESSAKVEMVAAVQEV